MQGVLNRLLNSLLGGKLHGLELRKLDIEVLIFRRAKGRRPAAGEEQCCLPPAKWCIFTGRDSAGAVARPIAVEKLESCQCIPRMLWCI